ncbi:MAG: GNAT family N-acetyltransferase [Rhodobacteraceae bacterium]|nr:GNAT family N-acetyltransferase [Paracoccaceae bacterium]
MDSFKLRPFLADDFEALHEIVSDFEVVKRLWRWPYPAEADFTRMRMNTPEAKAGQVLVIEVEGAVAGMIGGVNGSIGYLLGRAFWGRGIATWAVREMVLRMFEGSDIAEVSANVWLDNAASAKVLAKNGFTACCESEEFCKARGENLKYNKFCLKRTDWARAQPLALQTDRLVIEPFTGDEAAALSALMNDPDIAKMMATIPHPFTKAEAQKWLDERVFSHVIGDEAGFGAKVCLRDGTLIGLVAIGGAPANTAYAFGRAYWGQGFATEAMREFIAHCERIFALKEITAGAMFDNPASQSVLLKLGFEKVGEKMHCPLGRSAAEPLWLYRLTR